MQIFPYFFIRNSRVSCPWIFYPYIVSITKQRSYHSPSYQSIQNTLFYIIIQPLRILFKNNPIRYLIFMSQKQNT